MPRTNPVVVTGADRRHERRAVAAKIGRCVPLRGRRAASAGGVAVQATANDPTLVAGRVAAIETDPSTLACNKVVLAAGVWFTPLADKLGLPLIGEIRRSGVISVFGHHHIGPTSGPKSGRLVADLPSPQGDADLEPTACSPNRFIRELDPPKR